MKAIVLAAGYGTRLYPLTKNTAKALLDLGGYTLMDFVVGRIREILPRTDIFVVSNSRFYKDFLAWQGKSSFGQIKILDDGSTSEENRRGAVGDIYFVLKKENIQEDILVLGSDNIFDWGLQEFGDFAFAKNYPVVGLYDIGDYEQAKRFGVVEIGEDKRILSFSEKPENPPSTLISMCLYYFPQASLSLVESYYQQSSNLDAAGSYIKWLSEQTTTYGYVFRGKWLDIGHKDNLAEAKKMFAQQKKGKEIL